MRTALAAVLYRLGRYSDALNVLPSPGPFDTVDVPALRAMCLYKSGEEAEAHAVLHSVGGADSESKWLQSADALLYLEAKSLIGIYDEALVDDE